MLEFVTVSGVEGQKGVRATLKGNFKARARVRLHSLEKGKPLWFRVV